MGVGRDCGTVEKLYLPLGRGSRSSQSFTNPVLPIGVFPLVLVKKQSLSCKSLGDVKVCALEPQRIYGDT